MRNPESLDLSIQSALSALFPPFEATAPVVLSQLFRTIDERYYGDALQCMLDFLIPSKHLLESVQQAACAGFSDVVFRCEGWPLCLHDKTVIQLAPVNPLLLRPGDFYLQVEPFGDQAARIVLKSLLEEGCREVEETPIPETSYPCMFTEDWLQDINEGRQGTPLSRCLLCTDQGVIKLPWAKIAIPEFLDKPKIMPSCREPPPEPKKFSGAFHFHSATLPLDAMVFAAKDRMSASLRPADSSSKLVKVDHERRAPKSCPKPLIKPVGWVSPNSWDSHNYQEIEGDYVDLVDVGKGREFKDKPKDGHSNPLDSLLFKPVRPPPPVPPGNSAFCGQTLQYRDEPCLPLTQEIMDQDLKCRYRDSYLAALKNPVAFERGSVDLLAALEEVGLPEEGDTESKGQTEAQQDQSGSVCNHFMLNIEPCQHKQCCEATSQNSASHQHICSESQNPFKQTRADLKSTPCLSQGDRAQTKRVSQQSPHTACVHPVTDAPLASCDGETKPRQKDEGVKPSGKHKVKTRSLSTVSETALGSPLLYKLNNRSHSDICPETITSLIHCKRDELLDQGTPKQDRQRSPKKGKQSQHVGSKQSESSKTKKSLRDRTGRAVVEVHGDRKEWTSPLLSAQTICELLLYLHSIPRYNVRELGMTLIINAKKKPPPLHLYKALLMAQEQALHAVHSIVILMDKDTFPRPEKQPGLQMDMVTTMKALNKTVEASQLTSDLGGTFMYSHSDWLQFHQRLVSFLTDLREADCLLQKAIKKVDSRRQMDTAQEVQQCIQEQKVSMKEVLEDARLVTLQREGGALLARMKREEFRFPQSEDYRDALESVTSLYNQVEEKLHKLVMRSNESLQHLDFLFRFRETENKITMVPSKSSLYISSVEILFFSFNRKLISFFCLFIALLMLHRFMEQVEQGCYSVQTPNKLQMYEERLGGEFSTQHFQAVKAKVCSVGSGASGATRVWNAAWVQCQEVRHRLEEMQKKRDVDKDQIQQAAAASSSGESGGVERDRKRSEVGEDESSQPLQTTLPQEAVNITGSAKESVSVATPHQRLKTEFTRSGDKEKKEPQLPETPAESQKNMFWSKPYNNCHLEGMQKSREHYSEADLSSISSRKGSQDVPSHQPLGRSLTHQGLVINFHFFSSNMLNRKVGRIMEELLSTEREYVKALGYVREHYFPELERADVPQDLRGQRGSIFGNLEKLHDFHRHHFQDELESCVSEPFRVGRCFLRHKESFALYALYSKNKPQSDSLLINHGQTFFKQKQQKLGDKMDLWSYLLKPVQRISKYSLLLQDMMRECGPTQTREITEVKAALEVVHFQLRHGNNLLAMDAIHHCDVNLKEQGQLIRQDEFLVTFRKKKCFRHIFLFQELILFSKTRKTDVGNDTYIYKQSFKTSDVGMTQNTGESGLCFEIWFRKRKSHDTYTLQAVSREVKEAWTKDLERILWEQAIHNREVRMQERVFLGIGNKPFMDIQPSEAAISDRAINYVLLGRGMEIYYVSVNIITDVKIIMSSSFLLFSYKNILERQNLSSSACLSAVSVDSSESSGESVSGFSCSSHSYQSAAGGESEDSASVCASVITVKEAAAAHPTESNAAQQKSDILAEKTQPPDVPNPKPQHQTEDQPDGKVPHRDFYIFVVKC
uniref:Quattro n=1 Tax=Salarias fasciatus TaxID=181472 RepID=A0A672IV88_SALFA